MRIVRAILAFLMGIAAVATIFLWQSQWPLIDKISVPSPKAFDQAAVDAGARLALIGNCRRCHTPPGRADYVGNRPLTTPFGTIYSTDITPAPGSGIGHWSEQTFRRAMRQGISRLGHHLLPAFPYPHFALVSDDDLHALYAFLMTRRSVETYQQTNDLLFPLGQRWPTAFWNLLFLDSGPYRPDPHQNAEWNRGAYLVAGLGHCGDCHTPRNLLGSETGNTLAGGEAEGWTAPALTAASPAPIPWDAAHLFTYLRQGWDAEHGIAAGPMREVAADLAKADVADVRAIATYLAAEQGPVGADRSARAEKAKALAASEQAPPPAAGEELGATLFAGACARCHVGGPMMVPPRGISLALSSAINERDPRNALRIVLEGVRPDAEQAGPAMPGFDGAFTDAQLTALLSYLRAHYSDGPPWTNTEDRLHQIELAKGQS
jgi:mono/diheme cytochrome c family protein